MEIVWFFMQLVRSLIWCIYKTPKDDNYKLLVILNEQKFTKEQTRKRKVYINNQDPGGIILMKKDATTFHYTFMTSLYLSWHLHMLHCTRVPLIERKHEMTSFCEGRLFTGVNTRTGFLWTADEFYEEVSAAEKRQKTGDSDSSWFIVVTSFTLCYSASSVPSLKSQHVLPPPHQPIRFAFYVSPCTNIKATGSWALQGRKTPFCLDLLS